MKFKSKKIGIEIALCMTYFFSLPTYAALDDDVLQNDMQRTWKPYVAATYAYYDNLFLIPNDQPANQPGVDPTRSDSSKQLEAGVLYDQKIGLQEVVAHAKLTKTFFNHYDQLDYTGRDMLAIWNWKFGSVLEGKIGATNIKTLGSFADFHSQEKNLVDKNRQFASADWLIGPHWRVHTGLIHADSNYDLVAQQINDNTVSTEELGLDYLFLKGGNAGLLLRHVKGNFPNTIQFGNQNISNSYSENSVNAKFDWQVTGKSRLIFLGGWVSHTDAIPGSSKAVGLNSRIDFHWLPDGKLEFNFAGWRQYEPAVNGNIGFSLNTGLSGEATWNATSKIHFTTKAKYEKRDYTTPFNTIQTYSDATNSLSLQARYEPRQYLHFFALISHDLRSATIPLGGYVGNGMSIGASIIF